MSKTNSNTTIMNTNRENMNIRMIEIIIITEEMIGDR